MTSTTGNGQDVTGNVGARTTYTYGGNRKLASITNARENTSGGSSASSNGSGKGQVMSFDYDGDGHVTTWTRANTDPNTGSSSTPGPSTIGFTFYSVKGADVTQSNPPEDAACAPADSAPNQDSAAASHSVVTGERNGTTGTNGAGTVKTRYCTDGLGRVMRTTDAKGNTRSNSWTANSNVKTADMTGTGAGLYQYDYSYDDDSNSDTADSVTTPEGGQASASHDDTGHPYSVTKTDQQGANNSSDNTTLWNYAYDDWNNLIQAESSQTNASNDVRYRYCWTPQGQIARIDPIVATGSVSTNNGMSTKAPGATNRKSSRGNSNDTTSCLDGNGTGAGNDTTFSYNANGDLTSVDKPAGGDESYTYDAMSRLATVTDARGVTTTYKYDALDHVVSAAHSKTGQTTQTVTWLYDLAGNMTQLSSLNNATSGGANTYTYDRLNQLASESGQAIVGKTEYTYDSAGNLTRQTVTSQTTPTPGGSSSNSHQTFTEYTYDSVNLLKNLTDPRGATYTFDYDKKDKLTKTTYPRFASNGDSTGDLVAKAVYDNDGNPTCMWSYLTATSGANGPATGNDGCPGDSANGLYTYRGYKYTAIKGGQRTSSIQKMTDLGGLTTAYGYDNIDRLACAVSPAPTNITAITGACDTSGNGGGTRRFDYTYDRHSNLTKSKVTGTTPGLDTRSLWSAFNNGDEICASQHLASGASDPNLSCGSTSGTGTNGVAKYNHDQAGNLTTATGGGDLAGLNLSYNLPGQTTSITPPGATTAQSQAYDGVMQDRRTTSGPTQMAYGFSGLTNSASDATAPGGAHSEIFLRTPGGDLLAMIDTSSGQARYYLLDHQKSVIATIADRSTPTPSIGGEVTRYLYEPYGATIRTWDHTSPGNGNDGSENNSFAAPSTDFNPFGYASGYLDRSTGLIKFGTRYYSSKFVTWTQPDPEDGSFSSPLTLAVFTYAGADPVNESDSSGRDWWDNPVVQFAVTNAIYTSTGIDVTDPCLTAGLKPGVAAAGAGAVASSWTGVGVPEAAAGAFGVGYLGGYFNCALTELGWE
ncbi:RHS repeat-associated core domain-containing protein [Nocardioides acrostichi]|uniref:Teneurin-like YD-shell domain-containing protein n=1 Tax=Nocardioides acrostichi TaxID=2784339 RepID=A0A930UZZ6_9ACTN|nr:RHS repeat-associated core domain-containing protein [Nocardioides acrostichi]MBF4164013.1 hypothetical protein [Nocardioides acrostichi]